MEQVYQVLTLAVLRREIRTEQCQNVEKQQQQHQQKRGELPFFALLCTMMPSA